MFELIIAGFSRQVRTNSASPQVGFSLCRAGRYDANHLRGLCLSRGSDSNEHPSHSGSGPGPSSEV
eukprot:2423988-Rhodomonas_salina.3